MRQLRRVVSVASMAGVLALLSTSGAQAVADSDRLAGDGRYATATAISAHEWPDGAPVVYLARGQDPLVDALAGGTLTAGPTLLTTQNCGDVPQATLDEITRLAPTRVIALGGPAAVCDEQLDAAAAAATGATTDRLAGDGRYSTATAISAHQWPAGAPVVYLARGQGALVDALAGGTLTRGPVLLTTQNCGPVPQATLDEIARLGATQVIALGGPAAVCDTQLETARAAAGATGTSDRLAGDGRYSTATAISTEQWPDGAPVVYLARGQGALVDALAGGTLTDGPVLLTTQNCGNVPQATLDEIVRLGARTVIALGGPAAVCDAQLAAAAAVGADPLCTGTGLGMPESECESLVELFETTGGTAWTDSTGWAADNAPCDWFGVTCTDGNVTKLILTDNNLVGQIPTDLAAGLPELTDLRLDANSLTGPIPPSLGDLTDLTELFLNANDLTGTIPAELGLLTELQTLNLGQNLLDGPLPPQLGNLTKLDSLNATDNALTGPLPPQLGQLDLLRELALTNNLLDGPLPPQLGDLDGLQDLLLGGNAFTGVVPPELADLDQLTLLVLHRNDLGGQLPVLPLPVQDLFLSDGPGGNDCFDAAGDGTEEARLDGLDTDWAECDQVDALVALFNATDGPSWNDNTGWTTDPDPGRQAACTWAKVTCDGDAITELRLDGNNLVGTLPPQIGDLPDLVTLHLHFNTLSGAIPAQLGQLGQLQFLDAGFNDLSGPLPPQIGDLTELLDLKLSGNALTGTIPSELGSLTNLKDLNLGVNDLTGPIPPELAGMMSLTDLRLGQNQLTGPLPHQLADLANLIVLDLSSNQLTGTIPTELGDFASLDNINLADNQLTGPIPVQLGNLAQLQTLLLANNQLTGTIPTELDNPAGLDLVDLSGNQLTGTVPASFANAFILRLSDGPGSNDCFDAGGDATLAAQLDGLDAGWAECDQVDALVALFDATDGPSWTNNTGWTTTPDPGRDAACGWFGITCIDGDVTRVSLTNNGLAGTIPTKLGDLAQLESLFLQDNALTGTIPTELGTLTALVKLELHTNALTGEIPPELGNLTLLEDLYLQSNMLTGTIPAELGNLTALRFLLLNSNMLTGTIPAELGNLTALTSLRLNNNTLSGTIPPELGNLDQLEILWLQTNTLSGELPVELGNLTALTRLEAHSNDLTGAIPAALGDLALLEELYLYGNDLTGAIPAEIGDLTALRILNLHSNMLDGTIPAAFDQLTSLTTVNLRSNTLTGTLPATFGDVTSLGLSDGADGNDCFDAGGDATLAGQLDGLDAGWAECDQIDALIALFNATDGPSWTTNTGWTTSPDPGRDVACGWFGVDCAVDGEIQFLEMPFNNLVGSIPPQIGNLPGLRSLNLASNTLTGTIPTELGNLVNLGGLRLFNNDLTGSIPTGLGNATGLFDLYLHNNRLTGIIPPGFADIVLDRLQLSDGLGGNDCFDANGVQAIIDQFNALDAQWAECD